MHIARISLKELLAFLNMSLKRQKLSMYRELLYFRSLCQLDMYIFSNFYKLHIASRKNEEYGEGIFFWIKKQPLIINFFLIHLQV